MQRCGGVAAREFITEWPSRRPVYPFMATCLRCRRRQVMETPRSILVCGTSKIAVRRPTDITLQVERSGTGKEYCRNAQCAFRDQFLMQYQLI